MPLGKDWGVRIVEKQINEWSRDCEDVTESVREIEGKERKRRDNHGGKDEEEGRGAAHPFAREIKIVRERPAKHILIF